MNIPKSTLRRLMNYKNVAKNKSKNISKIQSGYSNFYKKDSIQPWIPVAAEGPWILTANDQIIYDTGGYGMLGLGHNNKPILEALSKEQVMANIMTPSFVQQIFWENLKPELKSYTSIVCLNSGSEANTLAMRLANIHKHPNPVKISLIGSFHGRTDNPAQVSNSCMPNYKKYLSDYQKEKPTYFIKPNDSDHAKKIFKKIEERNQFPEITLIEPVQGEGNPGVPLTPDFYMTLRSLTKKAGGLLLADSVQAGWRCYGQLSITNYPQFKNLPPPDFESFSKAISGGQFPLSILALNEDLTNNFKTGLYGNTMTGNPRALEVANTVLDQMSPCVRNNIVTMGDLMLKNLEILAKKYDFITHVTGTGLLLAVHLNEKMPVLKVEKDLRKNGLNVIHGGKNALRFTPWFLINEAEIDLIIKILDNYFEKIKI